MTNFASLWEALRALDRLPDYYPRGAVELAPEALTAALAGLTARIGPAAKRLAKAAASSLDAVAGTSRYRDLGVPQFRRAAVAAEVLRSAAFCQNSGRIDAAALQHQIHVATAGTRIVLELGWGQAKRDAGRLKTAGPGCDLAEVITIARLAVVGQAVGLATGRPAVVRVITGGGRFAEALFTAPAADAAYNAQRAAVASLVGAAGAVTFEGIERYWEPSEIKERLDRALATANPDGNAPETDAQPILFNIDWSHLLTLASEDGDFCPHGLVVPVELRELFDVLPIPARALLIRHVLAAVVNPRLDLAPVRAIGAAEEVIRRAATWAAAVAGRSIRKYDLLGRLTPRASAPDDPTVRLTVVEKPLGSVVPAFALLGWRTPYLLPQNVVPFVGADRSVRYGHYLGFVNRAVPVYSAGPVGAADVVLPWTLAGQPFCLAHGGENVESAVSGLDLFGGEP